MRPIRLTLLAGLALVIAGLPTAPGGANPGGAAETAQFSISVAGIPAGELTLSARMGDGRYTAASRIRATGLVGAVARLRFDGEATGRVQGNGRLTPERYTARSRSTRAERETEIVFENGHPARVSVVPPRGSAPDIAAQRGTLDPVSAAAALLSDNSPERVCNARVALFDGSRRSELVIGRAENRDGALVCNGLYRRVEGEAHAVSDQTDWPFRLVFRVNGAGLAELRRIETQTRFGMAVMERRG